VANVNSLIKKLSQRDVSQNTAKLRLVALRAMESILSRQKELNVVNDCYSMLPPPALAVGRWAKGAATAGRAVCSPRASEVFALARGFN